MNQFNSTLPKESNIYETSKLSKLKSQDAGAKDAFAHSKMVFQLLKEIGQQLAELNDLKNNITHSINTSSDKLNTDNDETLKRLKPMFDELLKNLCVQISLQKQENGKLQQKVADLKREKNGLQQMIILCAKKCAQMEEELGKYPK